jgi:hypothetical protein
MGLKSGGLQVYLQYLATRIQNEGGAGSPDCLDLRRLSSATGNGLAVKANGLPLQARTALPSLRKAYALDPALRETIRD